MFFVTKTRHQVVADLNAITNAESVRASGESYSAFCGRMELRLAGEKEKAVVMPPRRSPVFAFLIPYLGKLFGGPCDCQK